MTNRTGRRIGQRGWTLTLAVVAALAGGCGESGGGSGTGTAATTSVGRASSEGPIDGFGSVILNGVRWNTDAARFEIEGRPGRQSDLAIGMVVRVEGDRLPDGTSRADRVIFEARLRGPIRSIEALGPDARALEIFGVRALVSRATTRFEGTTLEALTRDTVVELSGFANDLGDFEVTYLRPRGAAIVGRTEVKLFGAVSGLAGASFLLGGTEVGFDDSTILDDFGPGGLRDGVEVRVEGLLLANDGVAATEIESPRGSDEDAAFGETEIQGLVTDFASAADFQVAGRRVDASRARFEPADPDLLRDGVRVEVEGRVNADGNLVAEKVKFRSNRVRIEAEVAASEDVDPATGTLWVLGVPIQLDATTRIRDARDDTVGFDLRDVDAGDFVEIRGVARSDGTVTATRFERDEADDLRLRGPVDFVDAAEGEFSILGVPIRTDRFTVFRLEDETIVSRANFFARVRPGLTVQAEDREDGNETDFDVADEVELEEIEDDLD